MANIKLKPIRTEPVLKDKVYSALKKAIMSMDIYANEESARLDERRLAEELEVSRTPIREALASLAQEGLVEIVPRKGAFVVRKRKQEIIDMIHVWAAVESMAARLATERASDVAISRLRDLFTAFDQSEAVHANIDEYSDTNIAFHQAIVNLADCELIRDIAEGLFIHMRAIRVRTIRERNRMEKSIIDHLRIIEAVEQRQTVVAEQLVREHALKLAAHVDAYVDYLD